MKQTLVIGSSVVDVIVNIPHLPVTGEDVHISKQSRSLGGCAYLTSDILRLFSAPYSLCTAVGGGIYGNFVFEKLKERGVKIYVRRPEEENGCCYCMVEDGGERTFIVDHGIEYTFYESYLENIRTELIDSVYICGLEIEEYTGMNIINYLKKHPEYQIYFSPSPRIMKIDSQRIEEVLKLHPVMHLNEKEIMDFTGADAIEQAARTLFGKTKRPVIVTLGDKGSYCFDGEKDLFAPPVKTTVVDTIGAGDSHMGAVIAARRFGLSFAEAIEAANYISAAVVAKAGGLLEDKDFEAALNKMPANLQQKFFVQV
ncbi:carbohydrate kinase family protein [Anaerotignum sp.]|uniref:carbohydrate kinase family protein n=1 Tax=Anaerotignum sp. TaxID=2039241 RepID=UPI0028A9659F|nr:PfkB family carbohydrate kinase [Anaerotignum sp.]